MQREEGETMNEEVVQQLTATADRLAKAAEALDRVLGKLDAQQEALNAKVDLIVAAVEDKSEPTAAEQVDAEANKKLEEQVAELERKNADLKAQGARLARKTLSPAVSAILAKNTGEAEAFDASTLDKTLASLSVEQRIAVKAEMARAGILD
jgi:predicted RNase H-like nuclease (RuvC/YqgF family)